MNALVHAVPTRSHLTLHESMLAELAHSGIKRDFGGSNIQQPRGHIVFFYRGEKFIPDVLVIEVSQET
jgi:hypothetical protein